ncbi:MAG: hypothetical protein RJB13_730 [Pseudomonadota bacterium]|jgi:hypothetical protein
MKRIHACVALVIAITLFSGSEKVLGNEEASDAHSSVRRLNRSVLTVGREVFTALDAIALLIAWNSVASQRVEIQSQWLDGFELPEGSAIDFEKSFKRWPNDVRTFFSIVLIWIDVQKLNLFIPKALEVSESVERFVESYSKGHKNVSPTLLKQIESADSSQKMKWAEMVLRAQSFLRIRGSIERNRGIVDVGWYWHTDPEKVKAK